MKLQSFILTISFLLFVGSGISFGLSGGATQPLTLSSAIQIALENNHDVIASRLDVDQAEARVNEAIGYALPSIDMTGRYSHALKKPVFFLPDFQNLGSGRITPIEIGSTNALDLNFTATQMLFSSAVFTGVGASHIYREAAREMKEAKELEIIANVRKTFYSVLLAREARDLMRANLKNAEENLRNVQLMQSRGLVSEYDELRASVGVENLRPVVIQTENRYILAYDALRNLMGVSSTVEYEILDSLTFTPVDPSVEIGAVDQVTDFNPMIKAMRHQVDISRAMVAIQWSENLPTLAAFGNYQYQAAKNDYRISTTDFINSSQIGLHLSLNIFKGWQSRARIEQAELEVRKSEERLRGFETGLKTQTHSIVLRLREARKRIDAQGETVAQAEKGYRIATTRFLSGAGTQLEVNDAQLALTQAKVNRIQAIYDYLIAAAELDHVLGRTPEFLTAKP